MRVSVYVYVLSSPADISCNYGLRNFRFSFTPLFLFLLSSRVDFLFYFPCAEFRPYFHLVYLGYTIKKRTKSVASVLVVVVLELDERTSANILHAKNSINFIERIFSQIVCFWGGNYRATFIVNVKSVGGLSVRPFVSTAVCLFVCTRKFLKV